MKSLDYYIVDVFTSKKYGGNQLAVFIDYNDELSDSDMHNITREFNFPELTFIKSNIENKTFEVRIFTPEYEVPFAGHPALGTAFIISKYLIPSPKTSIVLKLKHTDINIEVTKPNHINDSEFIMTQAKPVFLSTFKHNEIAQGLDIDKAAFNVKKPIQEISTGLPYIIIPLNNLKQMNQLHLDSKKVTEYLVENKKFKTNSVSGLTTALFFVTDETFNNENTYNTRMFCIENGNLIEDAATGSANGCLLAYLLKNETLKVNAKVEQGFQMNRKSYISLYGTRVKTNYSLKIGGNVVGLSKGRWKI